MEDKQLDYRPSAPRSIGNLIGFGILALVLCAAYAFWLPFSVMMPFPTVMLVMVMTVVLWQKAGPVPGLIMACGGMMASVPFGTAGVVFTALSQAVPAAVIIYAMRRGKAFEKTMRAGVLAALLGVTATAVITVALYGRNLIGDVLQQYRTYIEPQMPMLWQMTRGYLREGGMNAGGYTLEAFRTDLDNILSTLAFYYQRDLLANLLTGGMLSAVIANFWGSWVRAKQGRVTSETYKALADWHTPFDLAAGLVLMLVAGWLLGYTGLRGIDQVNAIVMGAAKLVFTIEFYARMDERAREAGRSTFSRRLSVVVKTVGGLLLIVMLNGFDLFDFFAIYGCISVFTSKTSPLRKWADSHKDEE
ncbi:MAG: DUF2232 domain-containing protein [Clostridiales bacterium]|nr:DUF2232 domain-containing protein [Clostridiales bacterium]